jgi:hypothetical protein
MTSVVHPRRLRIVHRLPGRVRFKSHHVKGRPEAARQMQRQLLSVPGVHQVDASHTTGSITMHFHPDTLPWDQLLLKVIEAVGLAPLDVAPAEVEALLDITEENPVIADAVAALGSDLLETVVAAWSGTGRLRLVLGLVLLLLGVRGLVIARIEGPIT